jgi:DNA polymerase sigma
MPKSTRADDGQVHPKLRRSELDPEQNLGTLLIEFFELYGRNFNYDDVGLSIRRGGFYFNKRSRGWYRAQQPFLLSIEDPQDRGGSRMSSPRSSCNSTRDPLTRAQTMTSRADHSA